MSIITVDDLAAPEFTEEALKLFTEREQLSIEFSLDGILDYAEKNSEVPVFRDDAFLNSLERILLEGDRVCGFTEAGKKYLATEFAGYIIQRSRLEALFKENPEIADVEIKSPVVIAGIPRSGTTNLSNIMASDSRFRFLSMWEFAAPFPSEEQIKFRESMSVEERMAFGREVLAQNRLVMPMTALMYDISFTDAMEELCFFGIAGCPARYMTQMYAPEWNHWYYNDMDPNMVYSVLKRSLQALNWIEGESRPWLLKTPHHLAFLPTLCETFPDLHLIVTHRDPASSTVSNATMNAYATRETVAKVDPKYGFGVAIDMAEGMIGGLVRDIDKISPASLTHVHFSDYMADVMGTLESIYNTIGMPLTEQARKEVQGYIDDHPRGRRGGKLGYNPERDFGVTREEIRDRYREYIDKFSVKTEETHA